MIDLRSDTVTKPTPEMRRAMAEAEVGDDVYGEDPTVRRLEELAAAKLERAAALFVPTGSMGNQIAVHLWTRPGSEVILEARGHIFNFEMGSMAALSGALPRPIVTADGLLRPEQVEAAINPKVSYRTPTRLLCLENTHNLWSGLPMPRELKDQLVEVAHRHGLKVHLDGARLFNAAIALQTPAAELARGCDSVMFCLSKGLAAPVGSMLVGDEEFITEARRVRKLFGGGMRQVGVLAAAGIVALTTMVDRLAEDHRRARRLAEGLAELPGVALDPHRVQTNIVVFRLSRPAPSPDVPPNTWFIGAMREQGVLCGGFGREEVRMVTHYHITDEDVEHALQAARQVLAG
ncbi:MAG: aminotransferase class I/II-fold pyridoxal phosphate-dependent enzyme [Thermoanaerobaculum sp.]|nr:aminotransferase class I/II-fold pyridoxal phosphate-dependent enzyme [Thermoanaerobaculum sp.]MDW7968516.1 GntG family PLP-dependent aldolase [Thermoanaerobaculum sp.]